MKRFPFVAAITLILSSSSLCFGQFSPGPNPITGTVGAQTLTGGTGTINVGGAINIASGSTVPLAMTGTSTLVNNGTIQTFGSGRAIDSNALSNLTLTNTGLISGVSADGFRVNTAASSVSLTNSGTIQVTNGGQAIDWAGVTGTNSLINQLGGSITSFNEDAIRPGNNGTINNAGSITATPTVSAGDASGSDGIDLRTDKIVILTNTGTISGRSGIATDGANVGPSSLTVNNNAGTIQGVNGSGLNVDGVNPTVVANVTNLAGATIKGGLLSSTTVGDGDGIDIDGVLTLNNSGDVLGLGAKGGSNPEGIAAGGGNITNNAGGRIIGSSLIADAPNGNPLASGNGILMDDSNLGPAIAATTVNNSGLIQGKSGFGIKINGTFANTITNNAGGVIRGAGVGVAAIASGDGGDTVTNSGTITGDDGTAIDLQNGSDTLTVSGGTAAINGSVDGGAGTDTLNFTLGSGNSFNADSQFSNFETINANSGTLNLGKSIGATDALWNGGAKIGFELGATPDELTLSNSLTKGTAGTFEVILTDGGGIALGSDNLITFLNTDFVLGDFTLVNNIPGVTGNLVLSGGALSFNVTGVPEPSSLVLVGIGIAFCATRRRAVRSA